MHMCKHEKSPENSNISSIKTQQSIHTAASLAGGTQINRQLSGDALQHVTTPAARKQLGGRDRHGVRGEKGESERTQGQRRGWLPKQMCYINLFLAGSIVYINMLYECVCRCSYYKAGRRHNVRSCFNTVMKKGATVAQRVKWLWVVRSPAPAVEWSKRLWARYWNPNCYQRLFHRCVWVLSVRGPSH